MTEDVLVSVSAWSLQKNSAHLTDLLNHLMLVFTDFGVGTKLSPKLRRDSHSVPSKEKSEKFDARGVMGILVSLTIFLLY